MAFGKKVSISSSTQRTEDHNFGSDDDVEEIPNPQTEEPGMESTQEEAVTEIQKMYEPRTRFRTTYRNVPRSV
ncbi:hypothetical protein R6Q59_002614 [Mikania micrantha]